MHLKFCFTLLILAVLQGCSHTPKQTLQPEDVPALYTPPAATQQPASVSAVDADASELQRESLELLPEQATVATDQATPPLELASLSPDMAHTAMDFGTTTDTDTNNDSCTTISAEIAAIDSGLGTAAVDTPPAKPPSAGQKARRYVYDLGSQTVLGQLQVFIQTKRAIFGDSEKERRGAEALERGSIRRAFLMGFASARNCQFASLTPAPGGEDADQLTTR